MGRRGTVAGKTGKTLVLSLFRRKEYGGGSFNSNSICKKGFSQKKYSKLSLKPYEP